MLGNTKLPYGSLVFPKCKVNEIATRNCTASKVFENLDISDVLEIIKLLLDYIKKRKQRELRSRARTGRPMGLASAPVDGAG